MCAIAVELASMSFPFVCFHSYLPLSLMIHALVLHSGAVSNIATLKLVSPYGGIRNVHQLTCRLAQAGIPPHQESVEYHPIQYL